MRISAVAALAGVPTATVRYYERRGLIAQAARTATGYRQFSHADAQRLRFIKHAQALGFSLEEVRQMLELNVSDPVSCAHVEAKTRVKIRELHQRRVELLQLERTLRALAHGCVHEGDAPPCPILTALTDAEANSGPGSRRSGTHA